MVRPSRRVVVMLGRAGPSLADGHEEGSGRAVRAGMRPGLGERVEKAGRGAQDVGQAERPEEAPPSAVERPVHLGSGPPSGPFGPTGTAGRPGPRGNCASFWLENLTCFFSSSSRNRVH